MPASPELAYAPPSPPAEKAIASVVVSVASDAKLVPPLETSSVRQSDHGPGTYFVCLREIDPPADQPRRIYATFFDNDNYKGARLAVIMDQCELQTYGPAPVVAPPAPPPTVVAKPAKRKPHSQTG